MSNESRKEYQKRWRKEHKEEKIKYARAYYLSHKKEIKQKVKLYRTANKKRIALAARNRYIRQKELIKKQAREYYHRHRDALLTQKKEYYQKIKDTITFKDHQRRYHIRYAERNKEALRKTNREYNQAHPEMSRARVAKRRAIKKDAPGRGFGPREMKIILERDRYKCLNCNSPFRLEFDHVIPLSLGGPHDIDNIQLLCKSCNRKKSTQTIDYRRKIQHE